MLSLLPIEELVQYTALASRSYRVRLQTINDAIISEIKSCKFCIADFSQQKDGVYFESGFAVGLGKPVIYTCHKDWFDKTHFDTNHFPHLIYENNSEFIQKLDNKIKAWIK